VETPLAKKILGGEVRDGYTVRLDADPKGNDLTFEISAGKKAEPVVV